MLLPGVLSVQQLQLQYAAKEWPSLLVYRFTNGAEVPAEQQATACRGTEPPSFLACPRCDFCKDVALHQNCTGHGTCVDGACECEAGWAGMACDVATGAMR